jgi:hypothetical protein
MQSAIAWHAGDEPPVRATHANQFQFETARRIECSL